MTQALCSRNLTKMFESITSDIRVEVHPAYVREQSNPSQDHYFFSYTVRIHNQSDRQVQLLARHWLIMDAYGEVQEVRGPGVVGLQPTLRPGEIFEYSSFCPLPTPTGSMRGTYFMVDTKGEQLEIEIPQFLLSEPDHYH